MTADMLILILLSIAAFCGLLQRVLDRMHLTDRQALLIIGVMLIGTFIPNLRIGSVVVNIGGGLIPVGVCAYLFKKADTVQERIRAVIGSVVTGTVICLMSSLFPAEAEQLAFDPLWLYGIAGGLIAWLTGRSRRCAYICGTIGVLLADILSGIHARIQGYSVDIVLGGAGIADAVIISGVTAVLLCEILGEMIERMVRKSSYAGK